MIYAFCDEELNDIFGEASDILDDCQIPYSRDIINVSIDNAKERWGQCIRQANGYYKIRISKKCLNGSHDGLLSTMIHEMIHTAPNCMTHKGDWKRYALIVNEYLGKPNFVKRTNNNAEHGISMAEVEAEANYIITCPKCGYKWLYTRRSKIVQHPDNYKCGECGTTLKRIK